jgi:SAM-dependent methyltransferase
MPTGARYGIEQEPVGERRRLLESIGDRAEVLDVGCWAGATGRLLARERGASVDGVEPDPDMAGIAQGHYRRVFSDTVEQTLRGELAADSATYDALLFLDVLEHLVDPWNVLRESHRLLRPGGSIFVSLPNVAYWSVRKELALGRWRYTESGLLDRTHLRFFTAETARELLVGTRWGVTWEGVSMGAPPLISLPERWQGVLRRAPSLFGTQLLFRAKSTVGQSPTVFSARASA